MGDFALEWGGETVLVTWQPLSLSLSLSPCFCVRRRRVKGLKMVVVNVLEISVNGGIFLKRGKRVRPWHK